MFFLPVFSSIDGGLLPESVRTLLGTKVFRERRVLDHYSGLGPDARRYHTYAISHAGPKILRLSLSSFAADSSLLNVTTRHLVASFRAPETALLTSQWRLISLPALHFCNSSRLRAPLGRQLSAAHSKNQETPVRPGKPTESAKGTNPIAPRSSAL